jgi:hypothetical protein
MSRSITTFEIATFLGCTIRTAQRRLTHLRTVLLKRPGGIITIKEFCDYEKINEAEFLQAVRPVKNTG